MKATPTHCVVLSLGLLASSAALAGESPFRANEPSITQPTAGVEGASNVAVIDVTGIPSMDRIRSPNNFVIFVWVGPFNVVNGIGWDVVLQTIAPNSRLSDISMVVTNSAGPPGTNFGITPAFGHNTPGGPSQFMRELADIPDVFDDVPALADGLIRLEFFDAFDEAPGQIDGLWVGGNISLQTLNPIPSPAVYQLIGTVLCVNLVSRRRLR